jgi:4-hydroxythreonine-4-phosphate dehydrogenase
MIYRPRLLITMGDVAGIGPEIIARAWPELNGICRPTVVGDASWLRRALHLAGSTASVAEVAQLDAVEPSARLVPCLAGTSQDLRGVEPGCVCAAAGRAAYDFLITAIDLALAKKTDGIVTAPLHKEGLHAAGLRYPGHTEILAERTGTSAFAMMLYARGPTLPHGLGVIHVTLHMALRDVFRHLTSEAIHEKIHLLQSVMRKLCGHEPRLAVAALNPHASDGGLFGNEEATIIAPAVRQAQDDGVQVSGPWPCDTLFVRAQRGEFDGVVAMYHDQGHIALKLLTGLAAVNVSVGLPIVRTSVAHGTAYDIAGRGLADYRSLIEAARVAATLASPSSAQSAMAMADST